MCVCVCVCARDCVHTDSESPHDYRWARPTDVEGKGSGQLVAIVEEMERLKRQKGYNLGLLRQLPRVYPAEEILNRAINAALRLKEDTSVKNSRQHAWGSEHLQLLSSSLTKPTGEILKGFDQVSTLSFFKP
jgi:hypothetical protein